VLEHEPELARTSLSQLARIEADRDEAQRVADAAQLRANEFVGDPSIDAALDFFNNIANVTEADAGRRRRRAEHDAA
jgi:hypothetical protein